MDRSSILNKIKEYYGIKKDVDLAKRLGISSQALRNWRARNSYNAKLIYTKCLEINLEWLLTGKGPMIKKDIQSNKEHLIQEKEFSKNKIPLYNLEGEISLKDIIEKKDLQQAIINIIQIPDLTDCNGAVYVKGDAMVPLLKNRDIIIFKNISIKDIFWGELYLIEIILEDQQTLLTIRHVQPSEYGEEYIKLISENINYGAKDIHLNKINAIALIRASIRLS